MTRYTYLSSEFSFQMLLLICPTANSFSYSEIPQSELFSNLNYTIDRFGKKRTISKSLSKKILFKKKSKFWNKPKSFFEDDFIALSKVNDDPKFMEYVSMITESNLYS